MKEVKLTNSNLVVLIDDEDYDKISKYKWRLHENGTYAVRNSIANGKQKKIYMHREIMGIISDDEKYIDHIDGNKLNNQKSNFRFCTYSQNNKNVSITAPRTVNSSSKYKGVGWYKKYNKWNAKIRSDGVWYNLGYFDNEVLAAENYDKAAILLHCEFACLNFPEKEYNLSEFKIPKFNKTNSSKYNGVSYNKNKKKYVTTVKNNGKSIFLGYFDKEIDAAKARDKYIIDNNLVKYFDKLNFQTLTDGEKNE